MCHARHIITENVNCLHISKRQAYLCSSYMLSAVAAVQLHTDWSFVTMNLFVWSVMSQENVVSTDSDQWWLDTFVEQFTADTLHSIFRVLLYFRHEAHLCTTFLVTRLTSNDNAASDIQNTDEDVRICRKRAQLGRVSLNSYNKTN
jgi:hypothetical protein